MRFLATFGDLGWGKGSYAEGRGQKEGEGRRKKDLKKGRGQEAAMLKEQSDGDSNPNRLNPPCRRWGFIPSWLQPEG
jgi:hypothetical protein